MSEKLIVVEQIGGGQTAVKHNVVALAVSAVDEEKKTPVVGAYVLLPTGDGVKEPLADLCAKFDLIEMDGLDGMRFGISPAIVVKVTADPSAVGMAFLEIRVPGVVNKVGVRYPVAEAAAMLNREEYAPAPTLRLV